MRKQGKRGDKRPVTELGENPGKKARGNFRELPNGTFMVGIHQVLSGNNDQTSSMQLLVSYTDVRHWEEMIDSIAQNCGPKKSYCLTAICICNLTQEELGEEDTGFYAPRQMMHDPLYGLISYCSSLSHAFKLKLGYNVTLFLVEMKASAGGILRSTQLDWPRKSPLAWLRLFMPHCKSVFLDFRGIRWKWKCGGWGGRWDRARQ